MNTIIKRDGSVQPFNAEKIVKAIEGAFRDVEHDVSHNAHILAKSIATIIGQNPSTLNVEDIQDQVEELLMSSHRKDVAKAYIRYRFGHEVMRQGDSTDKTVIEMLEGKNEYWTTENSNKNVKVQNVRRDYMAGILSESLTRRLLLEQDIVEAHDAGIIHFHDADYFAQNTYNCCLICLEDMLQNGTCINGVRIDKPRTLRTAMNIASQVVASVSSCQYGGITISLSHLAPFVEESRKRFRERFTELVSSDELERLIEEETNKEIKDSCQLLNYQLNTLYTSNGQAPFVSLCMYLGEVKDPHTKDDLAKIIYEFLDQRIKGFKNEKGVWITPAFPKLLYFLEEDNIHPESKYWYLTLKAAECTAKRLVPDYISEKMMKELKKGEVYPCMGCYIGTELLTYKLNNELYVESAERMWKRLESIITPIPQTENNVNLFFNSEDLDLTIYDTVEERFVKVKKVIQNHSNKWVNAKFSHGRSLICTADHPFPTNRGRVYAEDLKAGIDDIIINQNQYSEETETVENDYAWLLGFILCDGCYERQLSSTIAMDTENDIQERYIQAMKSVFNLSVDVKEWYREDKGNYKELRVSPSNERKVVIERLKSLFGGVKKMDRHIPNEVFRWNKSGKLSFLAGMIDADGYIHPQTSVVQIGSTNHELALQQMALAQSLGMPATVYQNHYKGQQEPTKIRWQVNFTPSTQLINYIACHKKTSKFSTGYVYNIKKTNKATLIELIRFERELLSYDVETETDHMEVSGIYSHNCRSFLTPDRTTQNYAKALNYTDELVGHKYYGRFNQGVITINLVDVALSAKREYDNQVDDDDIRGNMPSCKRSLDDIFWEILRERCELCHKALRLRHDRLCKSTSDVAPIVWQHGALARLEKGESIKELLYHGYSTISLGYAGLYECVKVMTGESQSGKVGKLFGLQVMRFLNSRCTEWKLAEDIDYSVYGTPIESTTYKFAKALKKRFGDDVFKEIDGNDRNYITNSYHIPVFEEIDPFSKLSIEAEFQALSPGGAISYIECADLTKNIDAVLQVIKFIYNTIIYAELNTKTSFCHVCNEEGQIELVDKDNTIKWRCKNCGNEDFEKMNCAFRCCGYISTFPANLGRLNDVKDRYIHLDDHEACGCH